MILGMLGALDTIRRNWQKLSFEQKIVSLLAFSLPFDRIPTVEVAGYTLKLSTIFGLVLIASAAKGIISREVHLKTLSSLQRALVGWIVLLALSVLQAQNLESYLKVVLPLGFLSVVALALTFVASKVDKALVFRALLLGAFVACVFGIYQFTGNYAGLPSWLTGLREEYTWQRFGFPRMQSVSLEPLYFSCFLLLPISLLTTLIIKNSTYQKKSYFALLMFFIFCDALTLSRGGLVALAFMFVSLSILLYTKGTLKKYWRKIFLLVGAAIFCIVVGLTALGVVGRQGDDGDLTYNKTGISQVVAHLTNTRIFAKEDNKQKDDSVSQRQQARNQAIDVLSDSPKIFLVGLGAGQYGDYVTNKYVGKNVYLHPGNVLLETIVQFGMLGLGLLAVVALAPIALLWKRRKKNNLDGVLAASFIAYVLAVALQSNFFAGLAITHVWFMIGIAISYLGGFEDVRHKTNKKAARTT